MPSSVEETVPDSGSPAISMIQGRQAVQRSSFSREFPAAWTPGRADFIESAEEPDSAELNPLLLPSRSCRPGPITPFMRVGESGVGRASPQADGADQATLQALTKPPGKAGQTGRRPGFCQSLLYPPESVIDYQCVVCRILYPQGRGRARLHPRPRRPCGCKGGGRSRFAVGRLRRRLWRLNGSTPGLWTRREGSLA